MVCREKEDEAGRGKWMGEGRCGGVGRNIGRQRQVFTRRVGTQSILGAGDEWTDTVSGPMLDTRSSHPSDSGDVAFAVVTVVAEAPPWAAAYSGAENPRCSPPPAPKYSPSRTGFRHI